MSFHSTSPLGFEMNTRLNAHFEDSLSLPDFLKIQRYVKEHLGIQLKEGKRVMVETRLRKRLKELQIYRYKDYIKYLMSPEGTEKEHDALIDVITTNKTDFYREPHHFDFLKQKIIPGLIQRKGKEYTPKIWSAACSKGAEPYTIALVMEECKKLYSSWYGNYSILATDISLEILELALKAVYTEDEIAPIPKHLRKQFLLKSKDETKALIRMNPYIRSRIDFKRLNLMDNFRCTTPMDIIFCRNVLIYFDKETQNSVIQKLINNLQSGGYLLMGHSETLEAGRFPVVSCAPSIYQKK